MSNDTPTSGEHAVKSDSTSTPARKRPAKKRAGIEASADKQPAGEKQPEPAAVESTAAAKRAKRRRRKGKGGGDSSAKQDKSPDETVIELKSEIEAAAPPAPARPNPPHRPKHDPAQLAKFAWKIYLAEVSEEGVALIHDNDAKELARRCFRLAEIFMDEISRRA